jgi:hypothetical protein
MGGSANSKSGDEMTVQVGRANKESTARHLGEQGGQGNVKQNTTHQGGSHGHATRFRDKDNSDTTWLPGTPTNPDHSRGSGGGGERDRHHVHDYKNKSRRGIGRSLLRQSRPADPSTARAGWTTDPMSPASHAGGFMWN